MCEGDDDVVVVLVIVAMMAVVVMMMVIVVMMVVIVVVMTIMQMLMINIFMWTIISYHYIPSSPQLHGVMLLFCSFYQWGHRRLSSWPKGKPTAHL